MHNFFQYGINYTFDIFNLISTFMGIYDML